VEKGGCVEKEGVDVGEEPASNSQSQVKSVWGRRL
jgi:hypothetical protein